MATMANENIQANNGSDAIDLIEVGQNSIEENDSQHEAISCEEVNEQSKFAQSTESPIFRSDSMQPMQPIPPTPCSCSNSQLYSILKAEHENLKQDYIENEAKRCMEIAKLQKELEMHKTKVEIRKQEVSYLSKKILNLEKSQKSLKKLVDTLKDLEAERMITPEAYKALEVT